MSLSFFFKCSSNSSMRVSEEFLMFLMNVFLIVLFKLSISFLLVTIIINLGYWKIPDDLK